MARASRPTLPAASVKVTLMVRVPYSGEDTLMPVTYCVADVTLPLPLTLTTAPPLRLDDSPVSLSVTV